MVEKQKKVLIISYYFPPTNTIGAIRIGKFAKYLSEFGWEPIILSVDAIKGIPDALPLEIDDKNKIRVPYKADIASFTNKLIEDNNNSVSRSNQQKRKKYPGLSTIALNGLRLARPLYSAPLMYRLFIEPTGWDRNAVRAALKITKTTHIDMIFSTFGPAVDHIIAAQINKQTGIPWIAEFRDHWSVEEQLKFFYFFDKQWEKRTLKRAKRLISISPTLVQQLESFHAKPTVLITNGFDESDFEGNVTVNPNFVITYTGNIYPGKRDPSPPFQAIAELKKKGLITPADLEMRFFGGNVGDYIPALADKWGVTDFVKMGGNIDFKESINQQKASTVLLSLAWNDPRDCGTLTGKIFEYIGSQKPVLTTGFKGGDLDILLQKSGCGVMTNDVQEIQNILLRWLEEFRTSKKLSYHFQPDAGFIRQYT